MSIQQNTPEWLEMRRSKIGASDCPIIMGLSPYKTPFQLFEEKVLGKEQETTSAMQRGHDLEEEARQAFEKMTDVCAMPKVVVHSERKWQMASLDGITFDGTMILEIKCPNKEVHEMAKKGVLRPDHMAQMQHQFSVTGAIDGCFFSYHTGEGVIVNVLPDAKFIAKMLKEEEKFYAYMESKEAPPLSEKDYSTFSEPSLIDLALEYEEAKIQADIHYQAAEKCKEDLIKAVGARNSIVGKLKLTRSVSKGQVDYKMIPELIGLDLEKYRKPPCEKWRITLQDDLEP